MKGGAPRLITLLTDFGTRDSYVGAMKGVIARIAPAARVIDLCHEVPPQDLLRAGLVWADAVAYYPPGCVHVAVVDPGVGSRRRILAFDARGSVFLAPDNGLIGLVLAKREVRRVIDVKSRKLFLTPVSSTFHGRDIFSPVAARLAMGLALEELGPPVRAYQRLEEPRPRLRRRRVGRRTDVVVEGEVIHADAFGNAVTNLRPVEDKTLERLDVGELHLTKLSLTYSEAAPGEPLVLVGSAGRIEIAVNQGSAVRDLRLRPGDRVVALWR